MAPFGPTIQKLTLPEPFVVAKVIKVKVDIQTDPVDHFVIKNWTHGPFFYHFYMTGAMEREGGEIDLILGYTLSCCRGTGDA